MSTAMTSDSGRRYIPTNAAMFLGFMQGLVRLWKYLYTFEDMARFIGAMARNFGDMARNLGDMARNLGAMARNLGAMARNLGAMARNLGDMARSFGDLAHKLWGQPLRLLVLTRVVANHTTTKNNKINKTGG